MRYYFSRFIELPFVPTWFVMLFPDSWQDQNDVMNDDGTWSYHEVK